MHPITIFEIAASIGFVMIMFVIALLLPKKVRKLSLCMSCSLTVLLLLLFVIRPYWIDYQVSNKTKQLNLYLEERYPNQEWEISRQVGRQYNPYHLNVNFINEKGWTYTYSVVNEKNIFQSSWMPPEGKFPDAGKHYE
ncbi:hypothetical protein BK120_02680 [Paenibacillus sp. FSL A5-0031]|uniref:hypothetical protein n=1 Tax=Paenibacillus sp. FSL A5-0031 TaxID=1920420 RepID=UPI00096F7157|nr:hypothetical protein [Paenibacillus sp. FSL A5-0031]OME88230.1 hypothetical protein BK120_02680 [Paenibacillus sp. FSL A5-0031]